MLSDIPAVRSSSSTRPFTRPNFPHILTRHEQGAAHAAEGYAKVTGMPGVCIATSGPGATNLVTGLADAYLDSVPVLAITGAVARKATGTDAFQEADITGITQPITKYNYLVMNPDELLPILEEAWNLTTDGRPGPVLVNVPKDLLAMADQDPSATGRRPMSGIARPKSGPQAMTDKVYAALRPCQRPLLLAGGGCVISRGGTDDLKRFCRKPGHPGRHDPDGQGRDCRRPPALSGQPRHARHAAGQYRHSAPATCCWRSARRFSDRIIGDPELVQQVRTPDDHPCRYRSGRNRQEYPGRHRDRRRCRRLFRDHAGDPSGRRISLLAGRTG